MPYPIRLERDTLLLDWNADIADWCTVEQAVNSTSFSVRSDGLLNDSYGNLSLSRNQGVSSRDCRCVGVHLVGPDDGSDWTAYAISVQAMSQSPLVRPFLFTGESPATITTGAAGDVVTNIRIIGNADSSGDEGATMDKEITVAINARTADRGFCVGVGMMSGSGASAAVGCTARLSVRRLVKYEPSVLDTKKIG